MEAIEFMKEVRRYCKITACKNCKISYACNWGVGYEEDADIVESVEFIKKWSEKHPVKTRQSEFLKLFPNVSKFSNGTIKICPCVIDTSLKGACVECKYHNQNCDYAKYWNEEVE